MSTPRQFKDAQRMLKSVTLRYCANSSTARRANSATYSATQECLGERDKGTGGIITNAECQNPHFGVGKVPICCACWRGDGMTLRRPPSFVVGLPTPKPRSDAK